MNLRYVSGMTSDVPQSLRICPVLPNDRSAGFDLLLSYMPPEERSKQKQLFQSTLVTNNLTAEGLLGAYRGEKLVGAVFSQIQPGKTAQVWLPRLVENEEKNTAVMLLRHCGEWLDQKQICLAQILLEMATEEDDIILREGGFDYLTDLLYLVSLEDDFPHAPLSTQLQYETYKSQNHVRLAGIVDSTYQGTLDCPKLNKVRRLEDVLEGYRGTGVITPEHWLIVRCNSRDVGCLLLADHPQHDNIELGYMGIIPPVRGGGFGMEIARYAQWIARQSGRPRLVLAVDASNRPAVKMYATVGFQAWDERRVYYRIVPR